MVKENSVSVKEMIRVIKGIIEPAFIEAGAKKRFIANLEACKTKEEVDQLCHEAVQHGMNYKPYKNCKSA
jgi:hypothetical protein